MPPKKKPPPSQAGKFKPLKRPQSAKKSTDATATTANAPPAVNASSTRSRSKSPPKQQSRSTGRGRGRGGRRGRGGSGRGRGGRGGRFVIPTGTAFFTGEAAKRSDGGTAKGGDSNQIINVPQVQEVVLDAGTDGAVYMPGGGSNKKGKSKRSSSKKDDGEEEEIVIADLMDVDEDDNDVGKKKKRVLDGPSTSQMFDNNDQNVEDSEMVDHSGLANQYLYDSDSSAEEERAKRRGDTGGGLRPVQLPFAIDPNQQTMYDCQEDNEEEKKSDTDNTAAVSSFTSKLSDPPLQSPFLDLETVSDELKQMESNSWYLMKFPTRLPHLDISSSSRKKVAAIKKEINEAQSNNKPDVVGSSSIDTNMTGEVGTLSISQSTLGYDDALKDLPSGRYGRIVVRKSGKSELIIGGEGEEPEVRLLIHEGLQCGFRQETVSIDPDDAQFVSLGNVKKSLVVTPNLY